MEEHMKAATMNPELLTKFATPGETVSAILDDLVSRVIQSRFITDPAIVAIELFSAMNSAYARLINVDEKSYPDDFINAQYETFYNIFRARLRKEVTHEDSGL